MANMSHNIIVFNPKMKPANPTPMTPELFKQIISETTSVDEDGETCFDFNRLIPKPEGLFDENCPSAFDVFNAVRYVRKFNNDRYQKVVASLKKHGRYMRGLGYMHDLSTPFDELIDRATETKPVVDSPVDKMIDSIINTGYSGWYEWSVEHWNTKWNAMDTVIDYEAKSISFETAWDVPTPVLEALFYKYQQPFDVNYMNDCDFQERQTSYRKATVRGI